MKRRDYRRSRALSAAAHGLIPGGSHTYAKGDDQYPQLAPGFIAHGEGCHVWDVDGNRFIEYGMGVRSVTLGHAHPRVVAAAHEAMLRGSNFTRPAALEVEVAEALLSVLPGEMIKFAKNGSDTTTAAVRLARAYTGRDLVGLCSDQPFFSVDDWFIGSTAMNAGIPAAVQALTVGFRYNDLASVEALFADHPGQIACLILEAARSAAPQPGFLEGVASLCRRHGALLVLDEIITGFRWHLAGAQTYYGIEPDLSTFGKGMANGFSVSALVGRREIMELGGLCHDGERVFLMSTTHGAESPALAAARATLDIYRDEGVVERLWCQGEVLQRGFAERAAERGIEAFVGPLGFACNLVYYTRDPDGVPSQAYRTLFLQELIRRGVLAPSLVVSQAHDDTAIAETLDALDGALEIYARALEDGVERYLVGRASQPVFRRFNRRP